MPDDTLLEHLQNNSQVKCPRCHSTYIRMKEKKPISEPCGMFSKDKKEQGPFFVHYDCNQCHENWILTED